MKHWLPTANVLPTIAGSDTLPVGRVVVIGDVVTDIVVRPHHAIAYGTDTASSIAIAGGGSGANTAAWIGALGGSCDFAGRVGADQADWHRSLLTDVGVRAFLRVDPTLPTARIVVLVDPSGERTMLTDRGANDALEPADVASLDIERNSVVHVSGYTLLFDGPRAAGLAAFDAATRGWGDHQRRSKLRGIPISRRTRRLLENDQGRRPLLPERRRTLFVDRNCRPR